MGILDVLLQPLLLALPEALPEGVPEAPVPGGGMSLPKGMTTFGAAMAALSVIVLTSAATLLLGSYLARLNTPTGRPKSTLHIHHTESI